MSDSDYPTGHADDSAIERLGFDQARATYESLVNTLPLCLLIKDRGGYRVFANDCYLRFRNATLDKILGKRDADLFPPDIAQSFTADDRKVLESGEISQCVEETIDGRGQRCWIERIKSPILDRDGNIMGLQLLFWDVTDRVATEKQLQDERNLLSNLLRHIPDSIYFKDRQSRFLRISDAMAKKFGLPNAAAALGKTDADIFSEEHADAARQDELQVMQTGEPMVDRVEKETLLDRDDTWVLTTKMPFLDENDQVIGTFGISRDITELKKYQDQLHEARDAADRANSAKSDFLANMSHEIRTPMNAVIGMSELLSQTELNAEQSDYVQLVRDSADSLLRLLNDILDFSKIEARKLELEAIPFSLRDLIEKTGRSLAVRAGEKQLELACRVAPELPERFIGDPGRLRQVMINLIGNAIKFTDEGEVVVEVTPGQRSDGAPQGTVPIRFCVRDTGIGIPAEKQSHIMDAFTQADSSTTRRFGGTGLGLAISRQLVELMHGALELESVAGFGTRFFFTAHFPLADDEKIDKKSELQKLGRLHVLVVDDNSTNRAILREILTAWQFDPTMADGGEAALGELQAAAECGHPFELAILDCMMPEMDGFELAARIRERYTSDQMKLIILSSATHPDDSQRCEQIGISRYMTKPVVQSELLEVVLNVMGMSPVVDRIAEEPFPECPPLRVLVAEDGIANQHVAVGMLQAAGHQAVVASDGREALAKWHEEPFDLILMDMHMPVMDGLDATVQIRTEEQESGKHIPIIALTAAAMKEDADACVKSGMDDYLSKPIHPRMLQEMMAKYAPKEPVLTSECAPSSSSEFTFSTPSGSSGSGKRLSDLLASSEPVATEDTLDLRAAAARVPGGLQGLRRLAEVFVPECESVMQTLNQALPAGDIALVQRSAHTLKGSADLFEAKKVFELCRSMEQDAREEDLTSAADKFGKLQQEVDLLLRGLRNFLDVTAG